MPHSALSIARKVLPLAVMIGAMGCTTAFLMGPDQETLRKLNDGKSVKFAEDKAYEAECASCHLAFLPGFLPDRSWVKLMDDLADHFGENASLDKDSTAEIKAFLLANAANSGNATPRSKKMAKLVSANEIPLRITETPFWVRKHYSVKGWVWKREKIKSKANCDSCHRDAKKGVFTEYDVQIPKA